MTARLLSLLLCLPVFAWAGVSEGQPFTLQGLTRVSFGVGSTWYATDLPAGSYTCGNATFGDPAPGKAKACRATDYAEQIDCYPAQLGGSGSRAAWGVSLSPAQAWAGWWCGGRMQVIACTGSGCLPDVAKRVMSTTSEILGAELKAARTEHIDSSALRAVWWPHMAEIQAVKP